MLLIVENSSNFHFEKHQPANIFVSTLVELKLYCQDRSATNNPLAHDFERSEKE